MIDYYSFLKEYGLTEQQAKEISKYREENVGAVQNSLNAIFLRTLFLIQSKLEQISEEEEGFFPQKEISSSKIIFEMWYKINFIENMSEEIAFDTITKAGYEVFLNKEQIEQIYATIEKTKNTT